MRIAVALAAVAAGAVAVSSDRPAGTDGGRVEGSGVWGTWVTNCSEVPASLVGLGVVVQWADLETADGVFSESVMEEALSLDSSSLCGRKMASFQLNANEHPSFYVDHVPSAKPWGDAEDQDARYLMYYHPEFVLRMRRMVEWVGDYLAQHRAGVNVVVVRQNWDAIGTEHFEIPKDLWDPKAWSTPPGVALGPAYNSTGTTEAYMRAVFPSYLKAYLGNAGPRLFSRNNLELQPGLFSEYKRLFDDGNLSWFHTSSEPEPHGVQEAQRYEVFRRWCRTGLTTCYAEPWMSAWGRPLSNPAYTPPPGAVYWRVLSDLANGVSFLAMYGDSLSVATTGTFGGTYVGSRYQSEFMAAVSMVNRYAGFVASPATSPGGFAALRRSVRELEGYNVNVTDYTFHVEVLPPKPPGLDCRVNGSEAALDPPRVVNKGLYTLGRDPSSRFATWARLLSPQAPLRLAVDSTLAQRSAQPSVCVTYLDTCSFAREDAVGGGCSLQVESGGERVGAFAVGDDNGVWKTARVRMTREQIAGAPIELLVVDNGEAGRGGSGGGPSSVVVHLVEVLVDPSLACSATVFSD